MNDDDNIDDNFDAIEAVKHQPAAPPPAPVDTRKTLGGETLRTPEEIRTSYGYKLIEAQCAATQASYAPQTLESKFYGTKR